MARRILTLGWILVLLVGCARMPQRGASDLRAPLPLHAPSPASTLHLRGEFSGPLRGLGPKARIEAWIRADGAIRADLRYEGDEGIEEHEVLLWTDASALLFDRRAGRFADLSETPGRVDAGGTRFALADAVWLISGTHLAPVPADVQWTRGGGVWRGRSDELNLRRDDTEPPGWTETSWLDGEGGVHRLTVAPSEWVSTSWGPIPGRLGLGGTDLTAHVVLAWTEVDVVPAMGDSILDPGWEP